MSLPLLPLFESTHTHVELLGQSTRLSPVKWPTMWTLASDECRAVLRTQSCKSGQRFYLIN